ncbi:MAG: alpha/beta fold hydrolase [Chloroflexi bacterium]|nr:alpha/beta fold hydrolase [Chloroflexota bacterium]
MHETPTKPKWRTRRYWLNLAAVLALALVIGVIVVFLAINWLLSSTYIGYSPSAVGNPADHGLDQAQHVSFTTEGDLTLRGWYVPPQNGAVIALLHGAGGNRTSMSFQAQVLAEAGFGVLAYDLRGHGESEGERASGWLDAPDLSAAVDLLLTYEAVDPERLGALGVSLGGFVALNAAAEDPRIGAVVSDGTGAMVSDPIFQPNDLNESLMLFSNRTLDLLIRLRTGVTPEEPTSAVLPRIAPRPVLFIAGGATSASIGDYEERYHRALMQMPEIADAPHELWVVEEAGHAGGASARPDEYAERIVAFFTEALLDEPSATDAG